MPCYHPIFSQFSIRDDGKKQLFFNTELSNLAAREFTLGRDISYMSSVIGLPCGQCIGCRLERSRQWAMRIMHEASLYEDNCFLTLTYDPQKLPADGSLVKADFQNFMKRLRFEYSGRLVRYYHCGEYGERLKRPHYHACIFNLDFSDKILWKIVNDQRLYTSDKLTSIWQNGFCSIGSLTFDSAAYVARYCTKKIFGKDAEAHYGGRQPEYATMSLKPGIGFGWYQKFKGDAFPSDYLIVSGSKCKPPRYYDKKLEGEDPLMFEMIKIARRESAKDDADNEYDRLLDREKCQEARFKKLIRVVEKESIL